MDEKAAVLPGGRAVMNVHVRSVYRVFGATRETLKRQCDELMERLLEFEQVDSTVRDASVGLDLGKGLVEIDVLAEGQSYDEAAERARDRIAAAVESINDSRELHERHSELVS